METFTHSSYHPVCTCWGGGDPLCVVSELLVIKIILKFWFCGFHITPLYSKHFESQQKRAEQTRLCGRLSVLFVLCPSFTLSITCLILQLANSPRATDDVTAAMTFEKTKQKEKHNRECDTVERQRLHKQTLISSCVWRWDHTEKKKND